MERLDPPHEPAAPHKCFTVRQTVATLDGVDIERAYVFARRHTPSQALRLRAWYAETVGEALDVQKRAQEDAAAAAEAGNVEAAQEASEAALDAVETIEGAVGWLLAECWQDAAQSLTARNVYKAGPEFDEDGKMQPWPYAGDDYKTAVGRDVYAEFIDDGLEPEHVQALVSKVLHQLRDPERVSRFDVVEASSFSAAPPA